jgi:quinol monooxygenase YgiN
MSSILQFWHIHERPYSYLGAEPLFSKTPITFKKGGNQMSVLVLLEAPVKSEDISNIKSYMAEILPDTRAYDGCRGVDAYFNTEDAGNMLLVEYWDSRAQYEKYVGWRTETGVMDKIGAMLAGPPSIRYFERTDA